jgi:hypothetical protein
LVHLIGHIAKGGSGPRILAHHSAQLYRYRIEGTYHSVLSVSLRHRGGCLLAVIFDDGAKPFCEPRRFSSAFARTVRTGEKSHTVVSISQSVIRQYYAKRTDILRRRPSSDNLCANEASWRIGDDGVSVFVVLLEFQTAAKESPPAVALEAGPHRWRALLRADTPFRRISATSTMEAILSAIVESRPEFLAGTVTGTCGRRRGPMISY